MESCNQAPIDVENPNTPLATYMKWEFKALPPLSSEYCIYRVPERLRSVKEKAYTPQVVSIGPLHHGKDGLKAMEDHKMRYLCDYIQRTNVSLKYYINIMKDNEQKLHSSYAETIEFSTDEFVKIILVDSAFIIEVLLKFCIGEFEKKEHEWIFHKPYMLYDVWPDLQLLENQLPFFILEELFDPNKIKFPPKYSEKFSIIKLSFMFFTSMTRWEGREENLRKMSHTTIQHLVHFLRNLFVPVSPRKGGECQSLTIPSITELDQAGVKFKVRRSKHLLDIHFEHGILGIPKLKITYHTESTMRNLAAFEQCHYANEESYICHYLKLLDDLVNTEQDVDLLVKKQIIEDWLGESKNVSDMMNKLVVGINIDPKEFYFGDIFNQLNKHYNHTWNHWKANLKQNYFNTPWAVLSVIAAVLIIILTVIQAVSSIISVI